MGWLVEPILFNPFLLFHLLPLYWLNAYCLYNCIYCSPFITFYGCFVYYVCILTFFFLIHSFDSNDFEVFINTSPWRQVSIPVAPLVAGVGANSALWVHFCVDAGYSWIEVWKLKRCFSDSMAMTDLSPTLRAKSLDPCKDSFITCFKPKGEAMAL